jgi:hypothetical protein
MFFQIGLLATPALNQSRRRLTVAAIAGGSYPSFKNPQSKQP